MSVWVFTLDVSRREQTCWYWTKSSPNVVESAHSFDKFEDCIASARAHGFSFDARYYITASRERLVSELRNAGAPLRHGAVGSEHTDDDAARNPTASGS